MLTLSVKCGQAVQIGEAACVRVDFKSGQNVRLTFATSVAPIRLLADGIIPARFTTGITGIPQRA